MTSHSHRVDSQQPTRHVANDGNGRLGDDRIHVVRRGDDLKTLAAFHGVSQQSIVAANRHLIVDRTLPLVTGDRLQIPQQTNAAWQRTDAVTASTRVATSNNYKEVVTLPRAGADALPQSKLKAIVDGLNGYMRPHHAELGERNRIVHVRGPNTGKEVEFPVMNKKTPMLDGSGQLRGEVVADAVKINYGQRKVITPPGGTPATYVYVIGAEIQSTAGHKYGASGWIPIASLENSAAKNHYKADLSAASTLARTEQAGGDAPQHYTLDSKGSHLAKYGDLKVNPGSHGEGVPRDKNLAASDYLLRPGGAVNLLYSLPGHGGASTDTFKAKSADKVTNTEFIASAGVPRVRVPLYLPKDPTSAERAAWRDGTSPHSMEFVYGNINGRYGWIAADALTSPRAATADR